MNQTQAIQERVALVADAPAIARLHAQSWRIAYRGALSDAYLDGPIEAERLTVWRQRLEQPASNQFVMLAHQHEQAAGFICAYGAEDPTWGTFIDNLHVAHEFKRQGIGASLMQRVAAWSRRHHAGCSLYLWVLQSNRPAQRFYESIGGTLAGEGTWQPPDGSALPKLRYTWPGDWGTCAP